MKEWPFFVSFFTFVPVFKNKIEMERRIIFGLFAVTCLLLSSCMGEGGNFTRYYLWGVANTESSKYLFMVDTVKITSSALEQMNDLATGDCFFVEYLIDEDVRPDRDIYEADIVAMDPIPVLTLKTELTDTAKILDYEQFINIQFTKSDYWQKRYFLLTQHSTINEEHIDHFDISYQADQVIEPDTLNRRVYELFLRVNTTSEADSLTLAGGSIYKTNAIDMEDFMKRAAAAERLAGKDTILFRINYPSRFNSDTTGLIWGRTNFFQLAISDI